MDCERTVNCPYNVSHQVSEERLQYHLVKCRRNHPWKENIHIFQVTKRATILESELDCEWNKVGGLIPPNEVTTLPPQDEDWNGEYAPSPLQTLDASDKPVFRNLPGATKSERKTFRREERCRFEKVIDALKQTEKTKTGAAASTTKKKRRSGRRSSVKQTTKRGGAGVGDAAKATAAPSDKGALPETAAAWKSVKSRSRKRGGAKKSSPQAALYAEKTTEESTPAQSSETEDVEKAEDVGELRVAFHDMNVVRDEPSGGVGAEEEANEPEFQALPAGDLQCPKNSVFQDWDKILIHDLPTTDCTKDEVCSPVTSFADILSKNSSSDVPEKPGLSEAVAAATRDHLPSSASDARRRGAKESRSSTRDKTPSEPKAYENYTNLNAILGRTSRKCVRTMFPLEPRTLSPDADALSATVRRGLELRSAASNLCGMYAAPVLESNPDSFFCARQETPFSYASILSKKPCSSV